MARKSKKNILLLYQTRGIYPLRNTIKDYLYSFQDYSQHHILYCNVAFDVPQTLIQSLKIDGIIFHTSFLGMRWTPSIFREGISKIGFLKSYKCPKVAFPQDEFLHTNLLENFLQDIGVTHVYSCAASTEWPKIYPKLSRKQAIHFYQVLTGYLHPRTVQQVLKLKKTMARRGAAKIIDIGYRAWKAAYWLGEHGRYKTEIAERTENLAQNLSLKTDISLEDADTFHGLKWFEFLIKCKATIGVEGGASILDRDSSLKEKTEAYLKTHPTASFDEVKKAVFEKEDGQLALFALSPRHLEACLTETYQILIEGEYNSILKPFIHYYPVKKDYSNLKDALLSVKENTSKITQTAFKDIILSERYTYPSFIAWVDQTAFSFEKSTTKFFKSFFLRKILQFRETLIWFFIPLECWVEDQKKTIKNFLKRVIHNKKL